MTKEDSWKGRVKFIRGFRSTSNQTQSLAPSFAHTMLLESVSLLTSTSESIITKKDKLYCYRLIISTWTWHNIMTNKSTKTFKIIVWIIFWCHISCKLLPTLKKSWHKNHKEWGKACSMNQQEGYCYTVHTSRKRQKNNNKKNVKFSFANINISHHISIVSFPFFLLTTIAYMILLIPEP